MTAQEIATLAHKGQFRRDGVTPYIKHPEAVAALVGEMSEFVIDAAWLHDVLEDTEFTEEELLMMHVDSVVVDAVKLLSHKKGEPYLEYIERLFSSDELHYMVARRVKLADIITNLSDKPTERQKEKYHKALKIFFYKLP